MSSYLDEFLSKSDTVDFNEISSKLPELDKRLDLCKKQVSSFLTCIQDTLNEQPNKNQNHSVEVSSAKQELISIEASIEKVLENDVIEAEKSYEDSVQEFNEIIESISIVHVVCEIHERIKALRSLRDNFESYEMAVELIAVLKLLIKNLQCDVNVSFIKDLKKLVNEELEITSDLLTQEFHKNCEFYKEKQRIFLTIRDGVIIKNLFSALHKNNEVSLKTLKLLSNFIQENLLLNVIKSKCKLNVQKIKHFHLIEIEIVENRNEFKVVFENLNTIVEFLNEHLNFNLENNVQFLDYVNFSLSESVLKECVSKSIPNDWKSFEDFKLNVGDSSKMLNDKLKLYDFFVENWNWVDNLDEFYIETRCEYFNDKAKEMMRKDLHLIIETGTPYDPKQLDNFLLCSISSYIPEFIKLAEELLTELEEGPLKNRRNLFVTYKGVFFNYADFVAKHHQKLLETIPQQVAVFFNNCNYLVRQFEKFDVTFRNNEIFNEFYDETANLFYEIQEIGKLYFDSFVDEQKKQIENILRGTNIQNRKTLDKLEENTEKLFRQCLRQQELLKTVWSKVLSYVVYNETIGEILNAMCNFIIKSLLVVEDIEAEVAENLIEIFKIVQVRGAKLFTDPNEVSLYVMNWHKFNELIFVLNANLIEINDRWADGKGPLALQFKPHELKQLVRALFQNTDRRANVLARIRD